MPSFGDKDLFTYIYYFMVGVGIQIMNYGSDGNFDNKVFSGCAVI